MSSTQVRIQGAGPPLKDKREERKRWKVEERKGEKEKIEEEEQKEEEKWNIGIRIIGRKF